ncbi:Lipase [Parasponia andersonii]|uniref:Lipase n=1 Tax=Parasponia andersonii TaxID=3476 RepID=A0A2P5E5P0_PARAD|nr:Lipase [Parasponia andersonii]
MTVHNNFPKHLRNKTDMTDYLSKSLFVIASGTSDYRYNFMQPNLYNASKRYNPDQYASLIVNRFGKQLKELYKLGARRFLVFEHVPLGCYPAVLKAYKPTTGCAEEANHLALTFNRKLYHKVRTLRSTHKDANITIAKT